MKPLDKKQIPQVVVLAVLAVAFFGYFAMKMILPSPAAARTQTVPVAVKPQAKPAPATSDVPVGTLTAPAPGAGMHDPFVQGVSDQIAPPPVATPKPMPGARTASFKSAGISPFSLPSVPPLPAVGIRETRPMGLVGLQGGAAMLPAAPATPDWTVTGVLQSGAEHFAILRSGDARRFVRQGDYLDSEFKVVRVTRDSVVLRHGLSRFTLPLGGAKTAPLLPAGAKAISGTSPVFPHPGAPTGAAPDDVTGFAPDAAPSAADGRSGPPVSQRAEGERASPLFPAGGERLLASGVTAPDFSLSTLGGGAFSLSQFRGNVVVLDFWSSWYAPAARSLATLAMLQKKFGPQGLTVLAVNSWDNKAGMQAALPRGMGDAMRLHDPCVSNESVAVRLYHASDVPTCYVIDRKGCVAGAFVGGGEGMGRSIRSTLAKLGVIS